MLRLVGLGEPEARLRQYPHELSGGQRQRVMIAIAMAMEPGILIADEPTTALDVTVQAQILDLMRDLQRQFGTSILLITHDMGVVAEMADRVVVMRRGRKVEEGPVGAVFERPKAAYTKALLAAVLRISVDGLAGAGTSRPRFWRWRRSARASPAGSAGSARDRAPSRRSTTCRSSCFRARPWRWSARAAPASRPRVARRPAPPRR